MKTIALIDPFWTGHHPTYLRLFSETILSLGHEVMVFCPHPQEIQNWSEANLEQYKDRTHCFEFHEPEQSRFPVRMLRPALDVPGLWRSAAEAIKKAHSETGQLPELVFFPWLDSCLGYYQSHRLIDFVFPYNWSGLYFHPRHLRQPLRFATVRGGPLDHDEVLRSRRCRAVAVLDEGIAGKLREKLPGTSVVVFPDVADEARPDRDFQVLHEVVAKSRGRKIIALLGGLARRKGILTLLEAARRRASEEWFFLFAGKLADETFAPDELERIRALAADPPENCFFHFDFIPGEARFNALVEVSDVLYAVYEDFPHSSNILTKAVLFEKPVIVGKGYCMEERADAFHLGLSINSGSVSESIEAIRRLLSAKEPKADFEGYRNLHSEERLRLAFGEVILRSA